MSHQSSISEYPQVKDTADNHVCFRHLASLLLHLTADSHFLAWPALSSLQIPIKERFELEFILSASSWHWTPLTSSSSYYLTTETPNINGGRPKGQFTIKSIHKAMSTNRLSTITLKLMKFSLLRVHHLSHSPLHFAEFTIHKGAPRPSPTGPVHRGTPGATSPHFYYNTLTTRCKLCPVGAY